MHWPLIFCLFFHSPAAVFCLYKSLANDELVYNFDSNKYSSLIPNKQQQSASQNLQDSQDPHGELSTSYNELNDARHRLRLLEMKIKTLENRIAKKYPDVLFLNYKNRKRILVSAITIFDGSSNQSSVNFQINHFIYCNTR